MSAHPPRAAVVPALVPAVPPAPPPAPPPPLLPLLAAAVAAAVVADTLADAPADDDGSRAAETVVAEVPGGSGTGERKSSAADAVAADAVAAGGAESLEDCRALVGAAVAECGTRFLVRPEVVAEAV